MDDLKFDLYRLVKKPETNADVIAILEEVLVALDFLDEVIEEIDRSCSK